MKNLEPPSKLLQLYRSVQNIPWCTRPDADLDDILDGRDESDFTSAWTAKFKALQARQAAAVISAEELQLLAGIREAVFKSVLRATSNLDAAAYASDDFELLGLSTLLGEDDPWLAGLLQVYEQGGFPGKQA